MRLHRLLLLLLMIGCGAAAAGATEAPLPPASCSAPDGGALSAEQLLAITLDWPQRAPRTVRPPVEIAAIPRSSAAAAGQSLEIALTPPPAGLQRAAQWQSALVLGVARRTDVAEGRRAEVVGLGASIVAREATGSRTTLTARLQVPRLRAWMFPFESWVLAIAACDAETGLLLGHAATAITVSSPYWAPILAALVVLGLYALLARAAFQANRAKLEREFATIGRPMLPWPAWAAWRSIDPLFVSQDAQGSGSLSRLQLLLFSLAVGFVSLTFFLATAEIAAMSTDVLWLLGISMAAAGFSRLAPTHAGLSGASRLWLARNRVLALHDRLPRWRDIVSSDGEIDVTRVQAVMFTVITLLALLMSGLGDLSVFRVSDEVKLLLGLSQAAYIGGKAVATEAVKQLEQAVRALAEAEARGDDALFAQAKVAAAPMLADIYGERFLADAFQALRRGQPPRDPPGAGA